MPFFVACLCFELCSGDLGAIGSESPHPINGDEPVSHHLVRNSKLPSITEGRQSPPTSLSSTTKRKSRVRAAKMGPLSSTVMPPIVTPTKASRKKLQRRSGSQMGRDCIIDAPLGTSGTRGFGKTRTIRRAEGVNVGRDAASTREVKWSRADNTMYIKVHSNGLTPSPQTASAASPEEEREDAEPSKHAKEDLRKRLFEVEEERARLMAEITARRQAAVALQRRARGMASRKRVESLGQKAQARHSTETKAATDVQRVARGRAGRNKVAGVRAQREKQWWEHTEWEQKHHDAACKIQRVSRGHMTRTSTLTVQPFTFAVGGHIFRHSGRKKMNTRLETRILQQRAEQHLQQSHRTSQMTKMPGNEHARSGISERDEIAMMFNMFDVDGDGFISVNDLDGILMSLHVSSSLPAGDRASDLISEADADGDGKLNEEEFINYMREVSKYIRSENDVDKKNKKTKKAIVGSKITASSRRAMMVARLRGDVNNEEAARAGLSVAKKAQVL